MAHIKLLTLEVLGALSLPELVRKVSFLHNTYMSIQIISLILIKFCAPQIPGYFGNLYEHSEEKSQLPNCDHYSKWAIWRKRTTNNVRWCLVFCVTQISENGPVTSLKNPVVIILVIGMIP